MERATGPWDVFRVEGDEISEFWPAGVFEIGGDAPPLDDFRHHEEHDGTAPCVEGRETRREDVGFVDWFHGGSYAVGESDARESVAVIGGHAGEFLSERGAVDAECGGEACGFVVESGEELGEETGFEGGDEPVP